MSNRPAIVVGDRTSHGGYVIEGAAATDTHGKAIARVGDKVTCPKKGHGTNVIATGDITFIIDGKAVATHGHQTACGAVLLSSQVVTFTSTETQDGAGEAAARATDALGAEAPQDVAADHDD